MRIRTERVTTLVTVLSLTLLALDPSANAQGLVAEEASSGDPVNEDGEFDSLCYLDHVTDS